MQRRRGLALVGIVLVVAGGAGGYEFNFLNHGNYSCPAIFAALSYDEATGFLAMNHPQLGTIEFVLQPNTSGRVTILYSSSDDNLTSAMFSDPVPAWHVDTSNGTIEPDSTVRY